MSISVDIEPLYRNHVERLQRLTSDALAESELDGLLLHAGSAKKKLSVDDAYWPLRPSPSFLHWAPLPRAHATILVRPTFQPALFTVDSNDFWDGTVELESDHFWPSFEHFSVGAVEDIGRRVGNVRKLGFIGDDAHIAQMWGVPDENINPSSLVAALDAIRTIKSEYEIHCTGEANRRAAAGHRAVRDAFASGAHSELELHHAYLAAVGLDSSETPYQNIVAIGEHAAILHHVHYGRASVEGASSLLVDAGATCNGYHADITRTTVRGDDQSARAFGDLVARLDELQLALIDEIRPGVAYEELHNRSHERLADVLRDVGLASASAEELVTSGATRAFFPHGLGHSLGLQTHDVGMRGTDPESRNPFLRNTSPVEVGQVFTIEPGCYFIESLLEALRKQPVGGSVDWGLVERLGRFGGIRIEDNIAVREDRVDNLTRPHLPS